MRKNKQKISRKGRYNNEIPLEKQVYLPTKYGYEYFVSLPVRVVNGIVNNARWGGVEDV
jgi:hypothetical protein